MNDDEKIFIITRTGKAELLDPNKITERLQELIERKPRINHVNPFDLMLKVCSGLKSGMKTFEIDEYTGNIASSLAINNPHYMELASRIAIDNHQKNTQRSFIDKMRLAYLRSDKNGDIHPLLSKEFYNYIEKHQDQIEPMIDYSKDFLLSYFGFRTFQRLYSIKINEVCIERPQDMFMRTAIALHMNTHKDEMKRIKETYNYYQH